MTALRAVLLAAMMLAVGVPAGWARIGIDLQAPLGNPDGAVTEATSRTRFLIQRAQYHLSYNDDTHQANWVSWSITTNGLGTVGRTDAWAVEDLLPPGYLRIGTASFGTHFGISWDRGHMAPSADRTQSTPDNAATFRMSNIIPQASRNNQGLWANFEGYCRTLAANNNEVIVISGPSEFTPNRIPNNMQVPASIWKIAVVVPDADSGLPVTQRIGLDTRVLAIITPNVSDGLGTWQSYLTSVEEIEEMTGFNFFNEVEPNTAIYLKNLVDTGNGPNNPTVITTFEPEFGPPGTPVEIYGYNFDAGATVTFGGAAAQSVSYNPTTKVLTAAVPGGASTGEITVTTVTGGTDTSYEDFVVTSGELPYYALQAAGFSTFTTIEGTPSSSQVYTVSGANLSSSILVTAPEHYEVSANGSDFSSTLTLEPVAGSLSSVPVHVRLAATAPVGTLGGNIVHSGGGADNQLLAVNGTVSTSSPFFSLSTSSLGGFSAVAGAHGPSKTYLLSAGNLTANATIEAPEGFEVSLDNSSFGTSLTISPVQGSLGSVPVYVRIAASAPAGDVSGTITHQSSGASTAHLAVSGTVFTGSGEPTVLAAWEVNSLTGFGPSPLAAAATDPNVTVGGLTRGSGVTTTGTAANNAWGGNGFDGEATLSAAVARGDFATFTITSGGGAALSFTQIPAYNIRRSSSGPTTGQWQYRVGDGSFVNLGNAITWGSTTTGSGNPQAAITLSGISDLQNVPPGTTVTFRLVTYGGTLATGTFYINDITSGNDLAVIGSLGTVAVSTEPVITSASTAGATAFASFSYQITADNNPTAFSAAGLPPGLSIDTATGVISGTPTVPGEYVIALTASNASGDGTATLTLTVSTNPNAPVISSLLNVAAQVGTPFTYQIVASNEPTAFLATNLPAGLAINTATGLITGTPTTVGSQPVVITAQNAFGSDTDTLIIAIRNPVLETSPASLPVFTAQLGQASASQSYQVTGSDLTENITVTAPPNFEVSLDNVNFTDGFTLAPAGGNLFFHIFVRLRSSAPLGQHSGSIIHSGSGAVPRYLAVSGEAISTTPTLSVTPSSLDGLATTPGAPSVAETYTLSGLNLTGNILVTAPAGYEISADEEDFGPSLLIVPDDGVIAALDLYVRLRADAAAGAVSGSIQHTGGGATDVFVTVSGSVAGGDGPAITSTLSGSAYLNATFSYTITTDSSSPVTGYDAANLPPGLTINTTTGVISGTPTQAGTTDINFSASNAQGTTSATYRLVVMTDAEQDAIPVNVVVNKYLNGVPDRIELLVLGNPTGARPVDLRGMILKDFNGNMATDGGGKFVFNHIPFWSSVKAGTLIVLAGGNSQPEDFDTSDFVISVNLGNSEYFTTAATNFDIGNTDMVIIKAAGTGVDGVAGGIHALCAGTIGPVYSAFRGWKTNSRSALTGGQPFSYVRNLNGQIIEFTAVNGATRGGSLVLGAPNSDGNRQLIQQLRGLDQDPPVITLIGDNPLSLAMDSPLADPGATAVDAVDGPLDLDVTHDIDTATPGTYTLTYRATDSSDNTAVATRTVFVLGEASPPALATSPAQSVTATGAALRGEVIGEGSSPTTVRGFVYSRTETNPVLGGEGVQSVTSGFGPGEFVGVLQGLSASTTYYFRAYATNGDLSGYGEVQSFTTLKAEPANQVTSFAPQSITTSNIAAAWVPASGADGYLLVVSSSVVTPPVDGLPVADDTDVSDGAAAVNLAAGAGFFDGFSGFIPGQIYSFAIYAFNNSGSAIDYRTASAPSFTANLLGQPVLSASNLGSALTTVYGTPSDPASFIISGNSLQGDVTFTASGGFEVSADNESFGTSVVLAAVDGILAATTVYVRLSGTAGTAPDYNTSAAIVVTSPEAQQFPVFTASSGNAVRPKPLAVTGLTASSKVYDGTADAEVTGTPVYEGLVNGENFEVADTVAWTFADKNVGANKVLVRTGDFTAPTADYIIETQPSLAADITPEALTVTGASVATKIYDTTTAASITGATLVGVLEGDTVTVSGNGTFNDANAGENKPVTANLILGGTDAANYTLTQPSLTGTITKADQTITFGELPAKNLGDAPFNLSATATSGLIVSYSSSNPDVASVSGSTVTILSVGETTITATQSGNTNYNAAAPVTRSLTVTNAPTLIAGWDFQTTTGGGTAVTTNNTPVLYQANFGTGTLHLDGTQGSSPWIVSTNSTTNQVTGLGGTTVNAAPGFSTSTASPSALALLAGASTSANGNSLVFKFGMSGRKDLGVSYATRGTATGFTTHTWSVSTNGADWAPVSVQAGRTDTTFTTITLPVITNADNAAEVYLRLTVSGATNSSGNNRLDNIQLIATDYTAPDTTPPVITLLGDNPFHLPFGGSFDDPGATAEDETDGPLDVTTEGAVDARAAGDYVITYTATDAAGNTATASRTVTVARGIPQIAVPPAAASLTAGQTLGESVLDGGRATVLDDDIDGTFAWTQPQTVPVAGLASYEVLFTPDDTINYTTATLMVSLTVRTAFEAWADENNLQGPDAAWNADPDGDGASNLLEYAFGGNPTAADAAAFLPSPEPVDGRLRVSAVLRDDAALQVTPLATARVEEEWSSEGVTALDDVPQDDIAPGFRRRIWETGAVGDSQRFLRLQISVR